MSTPVNISVLCPILNLSADSDLFCAKKGAMQHTSHPIPPTSEEEEERFIWLLKERDERERFPFWEISSYSSINPAVSRTRPLEKGNFSRNYGVRVPCDRSRLSCTFAVPFISNSVKFPRERRFLSLPLPFSSCRSIGHSTERERARCKIQLSSSKT